MNFNKTGAVANSFRTAIKVLWMGSLAGALFSFLAASALAQQAAETSEPALQEIIVTGSRIAAPNEQSTSPIQVLSSQYIETSGKSDVSDLLTQLPQNFFNALGPGPGQRHFRSDRRPAASPPPTCADWDRTARWCWSMAGVSARVHPTRPFSRRRPIWTRFRQGWSSASRSSPAALPPRTGPTPSRASSISS